MYKKTSAIIVLYYPDMDKINELTQELASQIDFIILVDNTPQNSEIHFANPKIYYTGLKQNTGIAKAQNIGMNLSNTLGANYIVFLDQDSIPQKKMINNLKESHEYLVQNGVKVGGIGPKILNLQTHIPCYSHKILQNKENIANNLMEVESLISSGTFLEMNVWKEIGAMEEELFIDGVDHEWCWRGKHSHEYRFFVNNDAVLFHQFGEGDRKILKRFNIKVPSPVRCFYQYRNYIFLCKRKYVPLKWKILNGMKYLGKIIIYTMFLPDKLSYVRYISKGTFNGILGKKESLKQ